MGKVMDGVISMGKAMDGVISMGKVMDGARLPVAASLPQGKMSPEGLPHRHTGPEGLPPGFRFHPTDEELVCCYLKPKIRGLRIHPDIIPEFKGLYKHEPWDLQGKSFRPSCDKAEFYLFGPRERKHPNGLKKNRATPEGYWKSTGTDRRVLDRGRADVGMKKTLVYHLGRAPKGVRSEWVMHEYRLPDNSKAAVQLFSFALCRVINKKETCVGQLPSSGNPSAAPEDDDDDFFSWMEQLLCDDAGCSTATPIDS